MRLNIIKNTKRNLLWGVLLKVYQIIVPIFIRRIFIIQLGVEFAGLGGLFSSVLHVLNLAEMGVGSAVIFFMYKPIAENDTEEVRRLMGLIRKYYRWIGLIILIVGLALTPFIQYLISGESPEGINVYVIWLMNLASSVLSYWLFAYKTTILSVHQRNDLLSRTKMVSLTTKYVFQLVVLFCFANYYLYLIVDIASKLIERFLAVYVANKKYPMYRQPLEPTGHMKKALFEKTRALILHKIGGIIVNSADAIVISAFLGLAVLGMYQNYFMIITAVVGFVMLIYTSSEAGIGNRVATNDQTENRILFERFSFLIYAICTICCCCFLNLFQPFIMFWLGEDMLLDYGIVIVLCAYFYVFLLMVPGNTFENASGLWNYDKFRPLLEGLLNLAMNLVLVHFIGLYGVLLSTIVSMLFFSVPWLYYNVVKRLLGGGFWRYAFRLLIYTLAAFGMCVASFLVCSIVPNDFPIVAILVIRGVISLAVPIILLFALYHRSNDWKWMCEVIRKMFGRLRD